VTNDRNEPDDAFEQMARNAGAALRRPPPSGGADRVRSARRRHQVVRSSIVAGATALVVAGLVVLTRPSDQSIAPTESPDASTAAPSTTSSTTTQSTTTTVATPPPLRLTYTLSGIEGLSPVGDPQLTDDSGDTFVAAWTTVGGPTDGYIVLRDAPTPQASAPEGDVTSVSIEVPDGQAYLVTDNGFETLPSATRVMWWRADGRLWIVSNFGLTADRLTELTLAIQPGSGLPYVLPDPAMTFVGFNTSESYQSLRQDWTLAGSPLTMAVTTGGLAQQLADGTPESVMERTIAGKPGYALALPSGQVNLIWPTDNPDQWGSLIVSTTLVDRIDEIAAAITTA
jgi:hypothetical protein